MCVYLCYDIHHNIPLNWLLQIPTEFPSCYFAVVVVVFISIEMGWVDSVFIISECEFRKTLIPMYRVFYVEKPMNWSIHSKTL